MDKTELITAAYKDYYEGIHKYIGSKVKSYELAADLTQDVFLRLLTYADMLRQETIKSFLYTIAKNIIVDHNRHYMNHIDFLSYKYDMIEETYHSADLYTITNDLQQVEKMIIDKFPPMRRKIYCMYSHDGMSPMDISKVLGMNRHAVYCQLFLGKKTMRDYFRKVCI